MKGYIYTRDTFKSQLKTDCEVKMVVGKEVVEGKHSNHGTINRRPRRSHTLPWFRSGMGLTPKMRCSQGGIPLSCYWIFYSRLRAYEKYWKYLVAWRKMRCPSDLCSLKSRKVWWKESRSGDATDKTETDWKVWVGLDCTRREKIKSYGLLDYR